MLFVHISMFFRSFWLSAYSLYYLGLYYILCMSMWWFFAAETNRNPKQMYKRTYEFQWTSHIILNIYVYVRYQNEEIPIKSDIHIYKCILCESEKGGWEEDTRRKLESIECRHCFVCFCYFRNFSSMWVLWFRIQIMSGPITQKKIHLNANTNTKYAKTHSLTHTSKKNTLKLS